MQKIKNGCAGEAKPRVYSCSGSCEVAKLAHWLASELDSSGVAEMGSATGVGGGVEGHLQAAKACGVRIVIDGCRDHCARACLEGHGIGLTWHIDLMDLGFPNNAEFNETTAKKVLAMLLPKAAALAAMSDGQIWAEEER